MKVNALIIAHAQVWMFALSMLGFIALLFVIVTGQAQLDATVEKLVYTMLGVFGTILTQQSGYFYAKQRPDGGSVVDSEKP